MLPDSSKLILVQLQGNFPLVGSGLSPLKYQEKGYKPTSQIPPLLRGLQPEATRGV